jgi:thiol-disulfide isomerase/thioredoxin
MELAVPFRPLLPVSLTLALSAFALAGCDRQAPEQPQADASAAPLAGTVDPGHAGELMPAVTVRDPGGKQLNLGALQGQPVLLNLWATWCAPCVEEMPLLDGLAGDYGDRLRVVTVSQDLQGEQEVPPFFAKEGFAHLEPWLDKDNALSELLGGGNLPTTVLYDASGSEIARVLGGFDWSSPEARALIDEAAAS